MNNKSTENLIESGESLEELFVPPLDLSSNSQKKSAEHSDGIHSESDHPKHEQTNFLRDPASPIELTARPSNNPPVPAVRKRSLPPIASRRNGKESKENSNQLTRQQQNGNNPNVDSVRMVDEQTKRKTSDEKLNLNSESDSDLRQPKPAIRKLRHKIELATLTNDAQKSVKKHFGAAEVNEETTSFISYEEKHEKEDNSEHLVSNHSSERNRELPRNNTDDDDDVDDGGIQNRAFTQVPDDGVKAEEPRESNKTEATIGERAKDKKSKKKEKRPKPTYKAKDKRKKRTDKFSERIQVSKPDEDIHEEYDFKRVIGVWIHETSALQFDPLIRQPRVRVSFYNLNDGELLSKSNPLRNAVLNYEPTNVTFIQPILSNRCIFKESSQIECDWNDELLIINEDIRHIQKSHVIIFFEIVDIPSTNRNIESSAHGGWYPICWAFLRPGDGRTFSNIDLQCVLQLHGYQRQRSKRGIIDEWKAQKRIKYPAYLSVTVGSYQPETTRSVSLTRPMSVLEEETTGDIYTCGSDGDDLIDEQSQAIPMSSNERAPTQGHRGSIFNRSETKTLNLESRLPGQQCKCPNRLAYRYEIPNNWRVASAARSQYGSMVAKFNITGTLLAFHSTANMRSNHEIIILKVFNLEVTHTLLGHLSIIYDLDWLSDGVLASVSSDRTAIIWFLKENGFKMKVLPHPSFVYAAKWLNKSAEYAFIATGGRDCVLRIWKICTDSAAADIELCDELIQHENYMTSLATTRKSTKIYSSDRNGVLLEWSLKKNKEAKDAGPLYQLKRKIKIFPKSIARIELHANCNRLYVQCISDPLIYVIEITSAIVIQTVKYADQNHNALEIRSTFAVSPCGTFLFTKCPNDDQIKCIRLSNDEPAGQFRIPISLSTRNYSITSLSYHPSKNLLAYSMYGDSLSSCVFVMCNETDIIRNEMNAIDRYENDVERDFHAFEQWQKIQEQELPITSHLKGYNGGNKSIAIDSILNRIDDLFFMAIRSPQHTDDNDPFKEVQKILEKMNLDAAQIHTNTNQMIEDPPKDDEMGKIQSEMPINGMSSSSTDSKKRPKRESILRKQNARASWQLKNTSKSDDIQSDSTQHTFSVEPATKPNNSNPAQNGEHERSQGTYSIASDEEDTNQSNLTFEIPTKTRN